MSSGNLKCNVRFATLRCNDGRVSGVAGTISKIAVPVLLVSFKGKKLNGTTELSWETSHEINTSHFIVERSGNGNAFAPIGQVVAAGNSRNITSYKFVDATPLKGNNFYRLKMVDKDDQFKYSALVRINSLDKIRIVVTPNPASRYITIEGAENFRQIEILNMNGKVVKTISSFNSSPVAIADLSAGTYIVRLVNEQGIQTIKFLKK